MSAHAVLSPSGSRRWLNCTPSARLEQEFDDRETEAAREGTAAHALCEHKLKKALRMRSKRPVSDYDTDEMEECSDAYVDFVITKSISRFSRNTVDCLKFVPEEAEVVRRIYREYLSGSSLIQIKRSLEKDGILTGGHNAVWHGSNIKQILTNEKYIGDALLQKTYTVNVLEKKRVRNNGIVPQYYVEGSHEPIISKEAFLKVQAEMARRASLRSESRRRIFSSRYALSGAVCCGHCGDNFRRIVWNNRGSKSAVWRCISRVQKKKSGIDCPARTAREKDLHEAVVIAVNVA